MSYTFFYFLLSFYSLFNYKSVIKDSVRVDGKIIHTKWHDDINENIVSYRAYDFRPSSSTGGGVIKTTNIEGEHS